MKNYYLDNLSQFEWDTEVLARTNPLFKSSHDYLTHKYNKYELTVSEMLIETQMSIADFYVKKKKGTGIPCYRQKDEKGKITFPLICIALFLSQDFKLVD